MHEDNHQPNPRRVAAGRENRKKRRGVTEAGRERLREAALEKQPWKHSTGPVTPQGKAQARLNGKRRQVAPLSVREARTQLAEVRALILSVRQVCNDIGQR